MGGGSSKPKAKYEVAAPAASPSATQATATTATNRKLTPTLNDNNTTGHASLVRSNFGPWNAVYQGVELLYFRHEETGQRLGKDDLFAQWERLEDEHNRPYFHDTSSGKTQWEAPAGYYYWIEEQERVKIRRYVRWERKQRNPYPDPSAPLPPR